MSIFLKSAQAAVLVFSDGRLFQGLSCGALGKRFGRLVFNTGMTGYQEVITDPSYTEQLVCFTASHIGNVGINIHDHESTRVCPAALIMSNLSSVVSHRDSKISLHDYLKQQNTVAIHGIDTRQLVHIIREEGEISACVLAQDVITENDIVLARQALQEYTVVDYCYKDSWGHDKHRQISEYLPVQKKAAGERVVVIDCGVKLSILRILDMLGLEVIVLPPTATVDELLALQPKGVLFGNGPGDPSDYPAILLLIQAVLEKSIPLFAICLGHQMLALACGAKTEKMTLGHHGINHPVRDVRRSLTLISSQNHGFMVVKDSLPHYLAVSHYSLFDGTVQGLYHKNKPCFSFQGHPEGGPGPWDCLYLFDEFLECIRTFVSTSSSSH